MKRWRAAAESALLRASHAGGWPARWLALIALGLFYAVTAAGNLSETDDAYAFAWRAEHIAADHVSDPRLLGYHLLARGLWLAAQGLGLEVSGLAVLRGISWAAALCGLWLLWRIAVQRLQLARPVALLATAALGLSYGFWRYAVEGDVYVPAIAACAAVLYGLLAPQLSAGRASALGAGAGLAVLLYQPNTIPLFLALPWLVARLRGLRAMLAYVAAGVVVAGGGYLAGFVVFWPAPASLVAFGEFLSQRSDEFQIAPLSLRTLVLSAARSVLTFGHDLVSTNWVWGLAPLQALGRRLFPHHDLDEEVFAAAQAGVWAWAGALTLLLWLASVVQLLRAAGPGWSPALRAFWRQPLGRPLLLWALLTALVIGRLNPSGAEAWIVFLLPLWLLLALLVLAPAVARHGPWPALCCVVALGLHNLVGGMALVHDQAGDLVRERSDWLAAAAGPKDLIVIVADLPLADALRYHSRAEVVMILPREARKLALQLRGDWPASLPGMVVLSACRDLGGVNVGAAARRALAQGGRIWVTDQFFRPWGQPLAAATGDMQALHAESPVQHRNVDGSAVHVLATKGAP